MSTQIIYETDFGKISKGQSGMVSVSFKEYEFDIALGGLSLFNTQLKRSPFVSAGYNPAPNYVVMGVKTTNTKLKLDEADYMSLRDLVQGTVAMLSIEDDIKRIL